MAYASGVTLSSLAGVIVGGIGAYFGYSEAQQVENIEPWMGAAILGGLGFVAGTAGAYLLKNLSQYLIFIVLFLGIAFFFRNQIEALTGINPVDAMNSGLERFGISLPTYGGS